ncbi:hypothetical protein MCOR27_002164 [Pyricularia oryzae]|uniref:Acid phosphatase n=1 Tax=Pyricularia grisea TaxID=148305 RepID=A0ABQ8NK87_PYRGI|nr:hypothetical protein MCOR01_003513 [Pyricularia oryzae]KAI6298390.1 hypothetical protein MCOR33_005463 [Pyricularia grisea]KAI6256333.1 hypothetical protein MCOR19_007217 [Pyricularia oryzae]KAI6272679.1 hypothetical protein MCOR26_007214 [Pyricularia oryzae]KAI6285644.1 hypothetical protein MCOR27_002164 [Pyricularia oryzae]
MYTAIKAISLIAAAGLVAAAASPRGLAKNFHVRQGHPILTTRDTPTTAGSPAVGVTATATADVAAAAATANTLSPTSNVEGKAFNRILQIYLETTAYEHAINNTDCQALINQGILLTNHYGVAAPSQPNYVAPASGDYYGTDSDSFLLVDRNVSTIVDLLEDKNISWGDYNEGLPFTGYDGFEYSNPVEGNYARKHNLLLRFGSVFQNPDRLAKVKNLTMFYEDLNKKQLPQWGFVTPNLYNNGHDTNISVSCNWTRSFIEPLLQNTYFNDGKTVIYLTWQADGDDATDRNHVAGILLGSAIDKDLVGTKDDAFYNHYSELSSVQANWGLHTLGRWDVGANVWSWVGRKTGDAIRSWNNEIAGDTFESYYWNQSYGGVFSSANTSLHVYPAPNLELVQNGRTVLPAIADAWKGECGSFPSRNADDGHHGGEWRGGRFVNRRSDEAEMACDGGDGQDGDYDNSGADAWDGADHSGDHGGGSSTDANGGCLPDYYRNIIEIPDAAHPPQGFQVPLPLTPPEPIQTPITIYAVDQE